MPDYGFPSQPRQFQMARVVQDVRARSDAARISVVTGNPADLTAKHDGRVDEILQIQHRLDTIRGYTEIIGISEGRAGTTQTSLQTLIDLSVETTSDAEIVLFGTASQRETFSLNVAQQLNTVVSSLNVSFGGRNLFSGDAGGQTTLADAETILADSLPFLEAAPGPASAYADLRNEFFNAGGLFETTFYTGGTGDAPVTEVAPGETVSYAVRGDDPALREYLFNVTVLALANDQTNNITDDQRSALTRIATDALRNNQNEVTDLSARVGNAEARIGTAKARNIASEAALSISLSEFTDDDPFEATVELTTLEEQLEATFLATARLANLSLTNFL